MDVEVTVESAKSPRAARPYRVAETLGLIALLYGLAASAWWIAIAGAVTIVASLAIYRRRHGDQSTRDPESASMSDDGGGGE
jgi:hypothetical protein